MLTFNGNLKVYVALEPCDMRKSFHGLSAMVRNHLGLDPLSGAAYLFTNKARNLIKILYFDNTGYWVVAKRRLGGRSLNFECLVSPVSPESLQGRSLNFECLVSVLAKQHSHAMMHEWGRAGGRVGRLTLRGSQSDTARSRLSFGEPVPPPMSPRPPPPAACRIR